MKFTDHKQINHRIVSEVMRKAWLIRDEIGLKHAPFEVYYDTEKLFIIWHSGRNVGVDVKLPDGDRLTACSVLENNCWREDGPWIEEFERVMQKLENDPRVQQAAEKHAAEEKTKTEKTEAAVAEQKRKLQEARSVFANNPLTTAEKVSIYDFLAKRVRCWESSWGEVVSGLYRWDHQKGGPGADIKEEHDIFQAIDQILKERND